MIPILYERGETAFTSNGLGRLPDCGMCQVTEERNGIFEVQFTYPVTGHNYENIREGRIIFCTHDESGVAQPFDIYARTQPIDGVVTFYAHHISYRLSRIILKPFTATNCPAALAEMQTQTYNPNPFTFWTDKTSSGSFSVTVPQPVRETLGGQAGSILDAFGKGDYEWDRFTVKLWQSRGRDTGVTIRYGVNMTDYNRDINYWEAYSGAVPYWIDPETGEMVTPGVVYAEGYDASNAEVIAMDLSEEWETKPTAAQVKARCEKRMRDNKSWLPTDNITISFDQLWQTEEYAAVAPLQRLHLCDRVNVVYGPGGVAVNNVQIIRVVWDVLKKRYYRMELGTARASFEQMIRQEVTEGVLKIVPTKSFLQAAIDYATDLINGGLGGHLVVNTDADGHPNELLIMDTDDISTAVNVWRWNLNGLGHSHNGYNGPFDDVAITMDGKINASMITTGALNASLITTGVINASLITAGTMQANRIKGGTLTLGGTSNGNGVLELLNGSNAVVGTLNSNGFQINGGSINLRQSTNYGFFVSSYGNVAIGPTPSDVGRFDGNNCPFQVLNTGQAKMTSVDIYGLTGENPLTYYGAIYGFNGTNTGKSILIRSPGTNFNTLYVGENNIELSKTNVYGDFNVYNGTKSRVAQTDQYGNRKLYCYETPSPLFGDVGEGEIGEDGKCYVWIDAVFAQTVSTDRYQVFLQNYGAGECHIAERRPGCFIVEGTPGLAFGWEIKAKQRDYDQRRLDQAGGEFRLPDQTYAEDAAKHIEDIRKEREAA